MADLRISDAPLLQQDQINDFIKLPTGGEGNYSIQLSDLAWYVIADNALANRAYVNQSVSTVSSALQTHIADKGNPHQVTKAQVGLDKVDNTTDLDKPVSNATRSAIITAVNGLATNEYIDSLVSPKADKTYVDNQDALKADKATTLVGYGIANAYTKTETDTNIANKTVNSLSIDSDDILSVKLVDNTTKSVDLTSVFDNGVSRGIDDSYITVKHGQVIRTLHDKTQELLSVKDFGAKGDGFTDDTEALKSAFNSGKSIFIPDGEYLYSQITVNTDLKITGTGVLKYSGAASTATATLIFNKGLVADNLNIVTAGSSDNIYNLAIFTADNVTIGNLILTSKVLRNQKGGCEFYGNNIRIDNVISENIARPLAFTNEAGTDLQLWRTNIHLGRVLIKKYIRGIKFRCVDNLSVVTANITGEWDGLVTKPGYNGILNENVKNATFGNLFIADSAEHAFRFGGDGVTDGWQIANLYVKDTRGCGFKIAPTPPFKVSNGKIGSITGVNIGKGDLTGNNEGVRITNAENLEISNIVILKQCSKGVSLADVTNLQINNITVESAAARVLLFDMEQDMASGNCANITINNLIGNVVKATARYAVELYYQDGRSIDNLQIHSAVVSGYSVAAVSTENASVSNSRINLAINSAEVQTPFYGLTDTTGINTTAKLGDNIFFGKAKNAYSKGFITADSTPFDTSNNTKLSSVFVSSLSATAAQNAYGGWLGFGRLRSSRRGGAITIQQTGETEAKNGLAFFTQNNTTAANEALQATLLLKHNGVLNAPQMPTSSVGLVKGDIWNDAGTLKIIP